MGRRESGSVEEEGLEKVATDQLLRGFVSPLVDTVVDSTPHRGAVPEAVPEAVQGEVLGTAAMAVLGTLEPRMIPETIAACDSIRDVAGEEVAEDVLEDAEVLAADTEDRTVRWVVSVEEVFCLSAESGLVEAVLGQAPSLHVLLAGLRAKIGNVALTGGDLAFALARDHHLVSGGAPRSRCSGISKGQSGRVALRRI